MLTLCSSLVKFHSSTHCVVTSQEVDEDVGVDHMIWAWPAPSTAGMTAHRSLTKSSASKGILAKSGTLPVSMLSLSLSLSLREGEQEQADDRCGEQGVGHVQRDGNGARVCKIADSRTATASPKATNLWASGEPQTSQNTRATSRDISYCPVLHVGGRARSQGREEGDLPVLPESALEVYSLTGPSNYAVLIEVKLGTIA